MTSFSSLAYAVLNAAHKFGCLRNFMPFLTYGVVLLVAALVASIPLGLGWLILGPVMAASIYTAYRDIYFSE